MPENQIIISNLSKVYDNGFNALKNINFKVKQGDTVVKGQTIANSSMKKETFHFQIRYKRNPVDPLKYLN